MELRHLRYFVAVAEAGGLTVAAQRKLHTSQPSLSRQIRDLEEEVGAQLLTRRPVERFSIMLAWCCRRQKRQARPLAGSLIPASHASRWDF
jgi:hypothetical protein